MIRVNLLAPGESRRLIGPRPEQRPALAGLVMLLCTLGGVGLWWMSLERQTGAVEALIAESARELARLQVAARLVDGAMARRSELAEKAALIERLRAAQRGPVALLSAVTRSLPDGLWLMELDQRGGAVQIEGRATSLMAVTDFAERLQSSGAFERPVEILATSTEIIEASAVVRFVLKAQATERPSAGPGGPVDSGAPAKSD